MYEIKENLEVKSDKKVNGSNNAPVKVFRSGKVVLKIWKNTNNQDDSSFYSVSYARNYKVGDEWKTSYNFLKSDLSDLSCLSQLAFNFLMGD